MASQIRAGSIGEICAGSGEWMIVDLGFSARKRSCGIWTKANGACVVEFGQLVKSVIEEAQKPGKEPLNLLLEAPLSVAFNNSGNPTRRRCDTSKDGKHRDWYVNAGATTLTAADHLLRKLNGCQIKREVRLFEGFVSFKAKGASKNQKEREQEHKCDVLRLKNAVWNRSTACIFAPEKLHRQNDPKARSAFAFLCKDLVPPVIRIDPPTN